MKNEENLEVAKKIIKAYWHEVASEAAYGYSKMDYTEVAMTIYDIDEHLETHIKTVIKIMQKALEELHERNRYNQTDSTSTSDSIPADINREDVHREEQ